MRTIAHNFLVQLGIMELCHTISVQSCIMQTIAQHLKSNEVLVNYCTSFKSKHVLCELWYSLKSPIKYYVNCYTLKPNQTMCELILHLSQVNHTT